jgi:hypothetical protein
LITEDLARFIKRKVLEEDEYATNSGHELIEWGIFKELPFKTNNEIRGWAILGLVKRKRKPIRNS